MVRSPHLHRLWTALGVALAALLSALGVLGCQRDLPLRLIEVHEVTPSELESGDRLEVHGAGFPQGRPAHLTFRGTLYRPGHAPERARIGATGTVAGQTRIELEVTEELLASFAGTGARAEHTTFRGEVEVVFASQSTSAPPIAATLQGVVLDVFPAGLRADDAARADKEGAGVLAFLGLEVVAAGPGLVVEAVAPGSRGEEAGLVKGDLLTGFDGVRLTRVSDVRASGAREVALTFRRGGGKEETRELSLLGLSRALPRDFSWIVWLMGLAVALVVAFVAPLEGRLGRAELAIARRLRRLRDRDTLATSSSLAALARAASRGLLGERPSRELAWLPPAVLAVSSAALFALPGAGTLVGEDVDVLLLFVAFVASSLTVAVSQERGLLPRLRALGGASLLLLPLVLALVAAVSASGSLRGVDAVRGQGAMPWEWNAFRSPFSLALVVTCVVAQALLGARARGEAHGPSADTAYRVGLLFSSGVLVVLFFGGYRLPGGVDKLSLLARIAGGCLLLAKTWALAALSLLVRFTRPLGAQRDGSGWRGLGGAARLVLVAVVAFATSLAWTNARWAARFEFEGALGGALVLATAVFLARVVVRVKYVTDAPTPHVDPFL